MTSILAGIGLTLNIIGILLIWRFGLPESVEKTGASILVADQTHPTEGEGLGVGGLREIRVTPRSWGLRLDLHWV